MIRVLNRRKNEPVALVREVLHYVIPDKHRLLDVVHWLHADFEGQFHVQGMDGRDDGGSDEVKTV